MVSDSLSESPISDAEIMTDDTCHYRFVGLALVVMFCCYGVALLYWL